MNCMKQLKSTGHQTADVLANYAAAAAPNRRLILLLQVLASFKVFAQILLITDGGPGTTTRPIILYIYEMGFQRYDLGYAAAMSYLLFMVLLVLSVIQLRLGGKEGRML